MYIGHHCLGHGAAARALLAASAHGTPPPRFIARLWTKLPESTFETIGGELWIVGRNYGHGWHFYAVLVLLAHPPAADR